MMIQYSKRITDSRISMLKTYLTMFLLLISVVSCGTSESDIPDVPDNGQDVVKGLDITQMKML